MKVHKYPINSEIWENENDLSYYILGAYMTDGCVVKRKDKNSYACSISAVDEDWIKDIGNIISPTKPIWKQKNVFKFSITDMNFAKWLMSYGCIQNKSKTLEIIKNIPELYWSDFIRGVIDGDGSVSNGQYTTYKKNTGKGYVYNRTTCYICSASLNFLKQVREIIPSYIKGNICNVGRRPTTTIGNSICIATCDMYRITFSCKNAKALLEWAYYPDNRISLKRKQKYINSIFLGNVDNDQ